MKRPIVLLVLLAMAGPAVAQTSIRGIDLSPDDAARVARQCDAVKAREMRSLAADTPDVPETPPSDAAAYWATNGTGMDEALSRINLGSLTLRDCRQAGFY